MSESQKYLEQLAGIAGWGQWEDQLRRKRPRPDREPIEEIRAGALMPDRDVLGCYELQLSTASGPRSFRYAQEVDEGDTQSEPTPVVWKPMNYADFVKFYTALTKLLIVEHRRSPTSRGEKKPTATQFLENRLERRFLPQEPSSQRILRTLNTPDTEREEYRKAIINAEVLDFGPSETHELTPHLRCFIETHRDSNVPADLVAVGSAIRKFIAIAPGAEAIDFAAGLLEAGSRFPLPIEIEVEISKMVVRKLTANPPAGRDQYSELASRLIELAETYLNPRLLGREKHGAVALNAVLGIVLARDPRVSSVLERIQSLGVNWFRQLLARQATILASELRRKWGSEEQHELLRSLQELIAAASPVSSN
ncbi:MAG: hypothetical protein ACHRXM_14950 [Isosphaerales bacterium]